jgi:hypothetical protein
MALPSNPVVRGSASEILRNHRPPNLDSLQRSLLFLKAATLITTISARLRNRELV